jgi:hypothetical protein
MLSLNHEKLIGIGRNLRFQLLLLCFSAVFGPPVLAQVKFSAITSNTEIGRNEFVQIEFVVENAREIERLTEPSFRDFHVVQGPIQSSGMSIVNGAVSQYKSITYILQPLRTGKFIIPAAQAVVDGRLMHSNKLVIEVHPGGTGSARAVPAPRIWPPEPALFDRDYVLASGENIDEKIRKNLFLKVQVSKTSCYVGEPIVATYKLYSHLQTESRVTRHPSLNGFSVYDMVDPSNQGATVERLNGKDFSVHIIRKAQLIPLQAGQIDLDPLEVENTVHFLKMEGQQRSSGRSNTKDLFDSFFQGEENGVPVEKEVALETKPVTITVKELPEANKPPDFNGAVGHFTIHSDIDTKKITEQDAASLKVTVEGEGNLPVVNAPAVAWPSGIETYDPSAKEDINKTTFPLSGTKTFQYSFVPKHSGKFEIPAISLSYFDPATAAYKTIGTGVLDFMADPASHGLAGSAVAAVPSPPVKTAFSRNLIWFFAFCILICLAIYLGWQNRRLKRKNAPSAAAPSLEVVQIVQPVEPVDPLKRARHLMQGANFKGYYEELNLVMWKALEEKLQLPGSAMNKHTVLAKLAEKGWDAASLQKLEFALQQCEIRLYTPAHDPSDMERALKDAADILTRLATT